MTEYDTDEIEDSPEMTAKEREAALWDRYEHLFWKNEGSVGRSANDPPEVKTEWAPNEIHASRGYKKGDNPFPPGYVRAEKVGIASLEGSKLENIVANIGCMTRNGMNAEEISDVLRVLECDVETERERLRREMA